MYKVLLGAIASISVLTACSGTPEVQTGDDAEVIMGGLNRVDNSRADFAYIDPQADFSKYNKVLLRPLGVDNVEIIQPSSSGSMNRHNRNWELTDADKKNLQDAFRDAMVKQLEDKGAYPVVTEADDDVLLITAVLTAIAPSAARDDNRSRPAGRSRVYTEGAGSLVVMVVYGDSETGEILGLIKDAKSSTSTWGSNNSVSNMSDVKRMFSSWAMQIRKGLDRVHGK
ncbi:MAG: DUF3313 family protein [Halieaceae bacterium]|jgi:hypothetical protein|nr:DUF3313 family protein [Halieaceae bacterium]